MAVTERVAQLVGRIDEAAGGRTRARVIAVLASVLALSAADMGAIGATAINIEHAFHVGKVDIGLLLTVTAFVAAAATLPFGVLVDRVRRTRLIVSVVGLWSAAMVASALAPSYAALLASRVFLGAVTAVGPPVVASLIGDYFAAEERARVYGMVLAGELVGTGFGIAVAGSVAAALTWRAAFAVLAVPALGVGWAVHRLREPLRGGGAPLRTTGRPRHDEVSVGELVDEAEIPADPALIVHGEGLPLGQVVRHVLRVRTNVVVIVSSALGYYLFAGLRAFGVEYAAKHYGVGQGLASVLVFVLGVAGIGGVFAGGRVADRLLLRGWLNVRVILPAIAFVATAALFAPAIATTSLVIALPLLIASGFSLALANPPLDAARLDVIPPSMWGRAEAVRTVVRTVLEALAPLVFGLLADDVFGGRSRGLEATFLIMAVPLAASGLVLLLARRTYLTDAASAAESS
jgi:predicted MFS family arabinose efflux permease